MNRHRDAIDALLDQLSQVTRERDQARAENKRWRTWAELVATIARNHDSLTAARFVANNPPEETP